MTDRPRWAGETAALAVVASDIHAQRAAAYPGLVAAGKLAADKAADGLRAAATVAIDWRRRAGFEPLDAGNQPATPAERIVTLEQALARPRHQLAKARAAVSPDSLARAACYADLPETERAHFLLDLAEQGLVADPAIKPWAFACEYLELVETLLWWERQPHGFDDLAALNAELRARARPQLAAAA